MIKQSIAQKVRPEHLAKTACLYARTSTPGGVKRNVVGWRRQREEILVLAIELGWAKNNIILVDCDDAVSGSSTDKRYGYMEMLTAIAEGKVGAVFSLEAARLGRDSADWHYLIKACDLNGTLIIDPDGVYDASDSNDSTLMKVKALMSEMELRLITNRLQGAKLELAKKGQLRFCCCTGFAYDKDGKLVLAPDESVQEAVRLFFSLFYKIGTAHGVVKYFAKNKLNFPVLVRKGPRAGEYDWRPLSTTRALEVLHNPRYAGVYVYGCSTTRKKLVQVDGGMPQVKKHQVRLAREEWQFVKHDAHPAYITWSQYLETQERLSNNRNVPGEGRRGAARSGSALLQGIALCGKCGRRMRVNYNHDSPTNYYICDYQQSAFGKSGCQRIPGAAIEAAVVKTFLEALAPAQITVSLDSLERLEKDSGQRDLQWEVRSKRAVGAVAKAKERLLFIDYTNKPAFDCAQADLKESEEELQRLNCDYESTHKDQIQKVSPQEIRLVQRLAQDLPRVWAAPTTDFVTKKNLLRCLIKTVTITKDESRITVRILWRTLACTELVFDLPTRISQKRTPAVVIARIRELAGDHTNQQIADALNDAGLRNRQGGLFVKKRIKRLRERYRITVGMLDWRDQREDGTYGVRMISQLLELQEAVVRSYCRKGRFSATKDPTAGWSIRVSADEIEKLTGPVPRHSRARVSETLRAFITKQAEESIAKGNVVVPIGVAV